MATIALVSLIAILAVATMSLTTRLVQESSLNIRDARLDAAAAFGLSAVTAEWRPRSIGLLAIGSTSRFGVVSGNAASVTVEVTRISPAIFWSVAFAQSADGAVRRQNIVLRVRLPNADSLAAESAADISVVGAIPTDSISAQAELALEPNAHWIVTDGIVHAMGNLTASGVAAGVLIVEGTLFIDGPFSYSGVIVAKGGIEVSGSATVTGALRVTGQTPANVGLTQSLVAVQAVLAKALMPRPVKGRPWSELY